MSNSCGFVSNYRFDTSSIQYGKIASHCSKPATSCICLTVRFAFKCKSMWLELHCKRHKLTTDTLTYTSVCNCRTGTIRCSLRNNFLFGNAKSTPLCHKNAHKSAKGHCASSLHNSPFVENNRACYCLLFSEYVF